MSAERRAKISPAEIEQIASLKRSCLPNYKIAESVEISLGTVEKYVKKLGLQIRFPAVGRMSPNKARILGYLHGDGCKHRKFDKWYYDYVRLGKRYVPIKTMYKKPRPRICLEFYNTNKQVLEIIRKTLQQVYECKVGYSPRKYALTVKNARVVKDLLSHSDVGCYSWRVPREILNASVDIQRAYIQAFGDAEATVENHNRYRIRFNSNNSIGLNQIHHMLRTTLGIPSKLRGPYARGKYYLEISGKKWLLSFREKIGFAHPEKADKLAKLSEVPFKYSHA